MGDFVFLHPFPQSLVSLAELDLIGFPGFFQKKSTDLLLWKFSKTSLSEKKHKFKAQLVTGACRNKKFYFLGHETHIYISGFIYIFSFATMHPFSKQKTNC